MEMHSLKQRYLSEGYVVINDVFAKNDVRTMISEIDHIQSQDVNFRRSQDLFAVRQFLQEFPFLRDKIFTDKLGYMLTQMFGDECFLTKSLYFDKPPLSNWFVAYHQDLTISVNQKAELDGYSLWTKKNNQYAVQPPLEILKSNFTIRLHLDDTNKYNGALKVIPGSHLKGIYRPDAIDWNKETEVICDVKAGGIMIMSPLLLHASDRTIVNKRRRVIHLEFGNTNLPEPLRWSEQMDLQKMFKTTAIR